jgi:hypothetical protein
LINKILKRYLNLKRIKVSPLFRIFQRRFANALKVSLLARSISLSKIEFILIIPKGILERRASTRPANSPFPPPRRRSAHVAERDLDETKEEEEATLLPLLPPLPLLTPLTPSKPTGAYRRPRKAAGTLTAKYYYTAIAITNVISLAFITNRPSSSTISIPTSTPSSTTGPLLINFAIVAILHSLTTTTTPASLAKPPILKARSISAPIAASIESAIPSTLKGKDIAPLVSRGSTAGKGKK